MFPDEDSKFALNLEPYAWELTLIVSENPIAAGDTLEEVRGKAILIATTQVDLTRASAGTTFTLRPDGLTTESTVDLTLKLYEERGLAWKIPESVKNVVCGIYSKKDGSIIDGTGTLGPKMQVTTPITKGEGFPDAFGPFTNVAPGTYLFKVFFCNKDKVVDDTTRPVTTVPDTSDPLGVWVDEIVILPGTPNTETVFIPNVIGKSPLPPTDFEVYYKSADAKDGYYDAVFEWKDKADNEQYYEIEIGEYGENADVTGLPTNVTCWPTADFKSSTTYNPSEKNFNPGSLGSYAKLDNPEVTIELEIGKQYDARIRAVNRAGNSDWVYVTLKKSADGEALFKGNVINLF